MNFPLTPSQIAPLIRCPEANVTSNWPLIEQCLDALGIDSVNTCIAALATVAVETAHTFKPIHEYGGVDYFTKHYENRADLGNTQPGDGAKFAGRGYVQITGRANYAHYGTVLGVDLVGNPDLALDPNCAASILATYFRDRKMNVAADASDWAKTRRIVNGGLNGFGDYMDCVRALLNAAYPNDPVPDLDGENSV